MSERRVVHEIPGEYQPVPRAPEEPTPLTTSCCRRPNCGLGLQDERNICSCKHGYIIPVLILFVLVMIVLLLPWETYHRNENGNSPVPVEKPLPCQLELVESLPLGLNYSQWQSHPQLSSTFDAWQLLLGRAKASLDIVSPHWTLRGLDVNDSSTGPEINSFSSYCRMEMPADPSCACGLWLIAATIACGMLMPVSWLTTEQPTSWALIFCTQNCG